MSLRTVCHLHRREWPSFHDAKVPHRLPKSYVFWFEDSSCTNIILAPLCNPAEIVAPCHHPMFFLCKAQRWLFTGAPWRVFSSISSSFQWVHESRHYEKHKNGLWLSGIFLVTNVDHV